MAKNKKIQLKKRSASSARIHKGLAMPVGPGSENSIVSFRDFNDLKQKYFRFRGRIGRRQFLLRTLILMIAQFMFTAILYAKIAESLWLGLQAFALGFALLFIVFTIPAVWSQLSLGMRRCHDLNQGGAVFFIPFLCYIGSYLCVAWGVDDSITLAVQSITAVTYLALATVKGTTGDNTYGPERAR